MMNPPPTGNLPLVGNSSITSVITKPSDSGFASLVNFKEVNCPNTRGGSRRIKISRLAGEGSARAAVNQSVPVLPVAVQEMKMEIATKKRWSFHSASQISELLQMDKTMRPSMSPKRRKSCGGSEHGGGSASASLSRDNSQSQLAGKSQPHSSKNVLMSSRQQPSVDHHRRRMTTGRLLSMRKSDPRASAPRSDRQRRMEDYFSQVDELDASEDYRSFRFKSRLLKNRQPEITKPDLLSMLPDEILLKVFKYLPKSSLANLGRTSHRFLKVIHDETLWKRLCVMGRTFSPEHLLILMSRKPVYLRMARAWIPDSSEVILPEEVESIATSSQLIYLDVSCATMSPMTLSMMMKMSPKLVKLSLENLKITNDVLEAMTGFAATIEVLNLTMCLEVNSYLYANFLNSCQKLVELNMGCMKTDWGGEELTKVVSALPGSISQLNISGYRSILDSNHVATIVSRCSRLIELDISDSQELQGKALEYMLKLPYLEHLGLSRCYGIAPAAYSILAQHKCLKFLDLFTLFNEASQRRLSLTLPGIEINKFYFSAVARPTVGNKRSSIWLQRVRD